MAATAKSRQPSYVLEVYGTQDGFFSGRVMCDGQPVGWVGACHSEGEVREQAIATAERHAAPVTLNVPLFTAGP